MMELGVGYNVCNLELKSKPHLLQRRARRHATINVVDFSDVTRCQNMVDVSDNVSEHT